MVYHNPEIINCSHGDQSQHLILKGTLNKNYYIDKYSLDKINQIISDVKKSKIKNVEKLIDFISGKLLGAPYVANRLIGSQDIPESLIIDLNAVDCSTYIDYVEALRRAKDTSDFIRQIAHVRYKNDTVSFVTRRHFFSDWAYSNPTLVKDITAQISPNARTITKKLNEKSPGEKFIPGIPVVTRDITYIPGPDIDNNVIKKLRVGDYIGIYSPTDGLDVTHVGIYTKVNGVPVLRNASSLKANRKVVDSPFKTYVEKKPGIVVFRASNSKK